MKNSKKAPTEDVTDRPITMQDLVDAKFRGNWIKAIVVYKNAYHLSAALPLATKISGLGNPLMYFARYTTPPYRVEYQIYTKMSFRDLRKVIMGFSHHGVKALGVTFSPCTGSIAHAMAFNMVACLRLHNQLSMDQMNDVVHWAFNMAGFSYMQEAAAMSRVAAQALQCVPGWTIEPIFSGKMKIEPPAYKKKGKKAK